MNQYMFNIARVLFFIGVLCALLIIAHLEQLKVEKINMCNVQGYDVLDSSVVRNGFYHSEGYYCVWTKGMTKKQIESNDCHEACHSLIDEDYNHFCEDKK